MTDDELAEYVLADAIEALRASAVFDEATRAALTALCQSIAAPTRDQLVRTFTGEVGHGPANR